MTTPYPRFSPVGDSAILVDLGSSIAPEVNHQVHALDRSFLELDLPGVIESVPAYSSLLVHYNPLETDYASLVTGLQKAQQKSAAHPTTIPATVRIPVFYGGEYGPDLDFVASSHDLSKEAVIQLHTQPEYQVYMIGFTPGFPYLGGLDTRIATPRLATPRTLVPAGSVGIAGSQTGIYPIASPGGWQIIGFTPLCLFDPLRDPPNLLSPGDRVCFYPIFSLDEVDGIDRS